MESIRASENLFIALKPRVLKEVEDCIKAQEKTMKEIRRFEFGQETRVKADSTMMKDSEGDQEKIDNLHRYITVLLGVIQSLKEQIQQTSNAGIVAKTMVAGLAHDLRNPMTVIGSCAQFCLENEKLTPMTQKNLKMIQEGGRTANKILNQFLEFSKVNLTFKSLNLNQIIRKTWHLAILETGSQGLTFKTHLAENLPEIFGDPEKLERVFLNLFLNAVQAVSQNCSQRIISVLSRFLPSENMAEIDIIDNGPGIPEEIKNKIFEPFFTTRKEGTGLGLHLCQHFIQQHKGNISIGKSRKGWTKVTIRLPITHETTDNGLLDSDKGKSAPKEYLNSSQWNSRFGLSLTYLR